MNYNQFSVKVMYSSLKNSEMVKLLIPEYPNGKLADKELFLKLI